MQKTVVVIEDEASLSAPIKKSLEKAGYKVFVEADGNKAMNVITTNHADMVLLDVMLPGKTGWEIMAEIGLDYKVIIITNLDSTEHQFKFKNEGALQYLVKSNTSLNDIVKHVNVALK